MRDPGGAPGLKGWFAMSNSDGRCMGCMNPLPEGRGACGICGYPADGENPAPYLPMRTVLSDRYMVGRVLEAGGDAVMYLGFDQVQKTPITIREFFPNTLCERGDNMEVRIIPGCENTFQDYHADFRNHARALARMRDLPALVLLYDIFEQNNTSYTVSEYSEGITLETRLQQAGGHLRWEEVRPLFMPLMGTLISLHAAGLFHLGICPGQLIIGTDGRLRLTGFAIAKARMVNTDLKPQLMAGYAAPEQYGFDAECGAAADVYGLAATIFRTLTGNPPPVASNRARTSDDLFVPGNVARDMPDHVAAALFNALQVPVDKRTPSMAALRDQLAAAPAVTELINEDRLAAKKPPEPAVLLEDEEEPDEEERPVSRKGRNVKVAILVVAGVFVVLLLLAFAVLFLLFPDIFGMGGKESSLPPSTISTISLPGTTSSGESSSRPLENMYAVADIRGQNYYDLKGKSLNGDMKLVVQYKQYSDQPQGTILSQDPAPESMAVYGSEIKLIISAGPEEMAIPDLAGWKMEHAKAYLELMGFKVEVMMVQVSDYPKGYVQDTSPAVGEKRAEGDTVILRVSDVETTAPPPTTQPTSSPTQPDDGGGSWFDDLFG